MLRKGKKKKAKLPSSEDIPMTAWALFRSTPSQMAYATNSHATFTLRAGDKRAFTLNTGSLPPRAELDHLVLISKGNQHHLCY